jgi:hypothetical protein
MPVYVEPCSNPNCTHAALHDCSMCYKAFCLLHIERVKSTYYCLTCYNKLDKKYL